MILVFRTNISSEQQIQTLKPELDLLIENNKWSFDLEDCDSILRVETKHNIASKIIDVLNSKGCEAIELL